MKVMLCTPYMKTPDNIPGGIGIWGKNMLEYYHTINSDIELYPVSFDRKNYVSVDTSTIVRLVSSLQFLSAVNEARQILRKVHPDVLHVCTSASLSLVKDLMLVKMAKRYGAKSVVHFRFGRIPELIQQKNWEWRLLHAVIENASHVVTIDQKSYKALQNLGYNKISYCPNALFMPILNRINGLAYTVERIPGKLLFVGHVLPSKGVYELVEACKQFDGIELHIIGKAEEPVRSELIQIAAEKDGGSWMKMRGEIPHDEVLREMMSASVFVFPSYTEGFPNVILEAMACGCPIVTTTVGAIPEMLDVANGNNYGICVEPQSTQAFANGLKQMLSDPNYANRCAENAKKRVNEMYAVPVVWGQLSNIWKNV